MAFTKGSGPVSQFLVVSTLIYLYTLLHSVSAVFQGVVEIRGYVGQHVQLPCHNQSPNSEFTFLYLQKIDNNNNVIFVNGIHKSNSVENSIHTMFKNRTMVNETNKTVDLWDLRTSDEGKYECIINYNFTKTSHINLKIMSNYSQPKVVVVRNNSGRSSDTSCTVKIHCFSSGGYPQKMVKWNFTKELNISLRITEVNKSAEQDPGNGLFNISSTIFVNSSGAFNVSCSVGEETSKEIEVCVDNPDPKLPAEFDPTQNIAFGVILILISIVLLCLLIKKIKAPAARGIYSVTATSEEHQEHDMCEVNTPANS
ncbi:T-lymphocyte activation antigen CD80 [Amia ocellicauda]|uniref:T-lymphocyte activation antigen CD80 n=1 Tax=Amia ocellicauda TaxID=2972642 RepID=UPI003463C5D7